MSPQGETALHGLRFAVRKPVLLYSYLCPYDPPYKGRKWRGDAQRALLFLASSRRRVLGVQFTGKDDDDDDDDNDDGGRQTDGGLFASQRQAIQTGLDRFEV